MEENNELYFDYKRDEMHEKFSGLTYEELEELGVITTLYIDENNQNISQISIRNITFKEAVDMGIISENNIPG